MGGGKAIKSKEPQKLPEIFVFLKEGIPGFLRILNHVHDLKQVKKRHWLKCMEGKQPLNSAGGRGTWNSHSGEQFTSNLEIGN